MRYMYQPHSCSKITVTCKDDDVIFVYFYLTFIEKSWQPSSQSCPRERSAPDFSEGMTCPLRAVGLRKVNGSSQV